MYGRHWYKQHCSSKVVIVRLKQTQVEISSDFMYLFLSSAILDPGKLIIYGVPLFSMKQPNMDETLTVSSCF